MKFEKKTLAKLSCNVHKRRHSVYLSRSAEWSAILFNYGKMAGYRLPLL